MNKRAYGIEKSIGVAAVVTVMGCAVGTSDGGPAPAASAASTAAPAAATRATSLRVEQASRQIDLGKDVPAARSALEAILRDPELSSDERDQAALSLSRALDLEGEREGAIRTLEDLLAAHVEDHRWPLEQTTQERLSRLLTGAELPRFNQNDEADEGTVAPFARVLTRYFPEMSPGRFEVKILAIGGHDSASERLGTFNVGGAIKAMRRQACPLCDDHVNINTTSGRTGNWLSIPAYRELLGDELTIFYFDLEQLRVPARYDAQLPMPSAEVVARLEKGDGLIVARERRGAPPAILIAAPRWAELASVEEALAAMKSLPTEPVAVKLDPALRPGEIRAAIRGSRQALRECFEGLLARAPDVSGKVSFKFAIQGDGAVADLAIEADASLRDATFETCISAPVRALRFPATGRKTTVAYPVTFAAGDDAPAAR